MIGCLILIFLVLVLIYFMLWDVRDLLRQILRILP
jgi:predicted PurR-regulated permease PerM